MRTKEFLLCSLFWSFSHSRSLLQERDPIIASTGGIDSSSEPPVDSATLGPIDYPADIPPVQTPQGTLGKAPPKESEEYQSRIFLPTSVKYPIVQCPRVTKLSNCKCREACYDLSTRRMDYYNIVEANFQDCLAYALYDNETLQDDNERLQEGEQATLSIAWYNFEIGDGSPGARERIKKAQKDLPKCMRFENHADSINIIDKPNCNKFIVYDIWNCPDYTEG